MIHRFNIMFCDSIYRLLTLWRLGEERAGFVRDSMGHEEWWMSQPLQWES